MTEDTVWRNLADVVLLLGRNSSFAMLFKGKENLGGECGKWFSQGVISPVLVKLFYNSRMNWVSRHVTLPLLLTVFLCVSW